MEITGIIPDLSVKAVRSALDGFEPDIILSVFEGGVYRTAAKVAKSLGKPLVLIVYDLSELFERPFPGFRWLRGWRDGSTYRFASVRFCVSQPLAETFEKRFGAPGTLLYPIRSEAIEARPAEQSRSLRSPPNLVVGFAGTLGYGYGQQLARMMPSFRNAGAKLFVYSRYNPESSDLFRGADDVVVARGFSPSPEETWKRIKDECDAVILPYDFHADAAQEMLYRTHFPSKLTEYTALQMPILIVGQPTTGGAQWASRHPNATMLATDASPERWAEALSELKTNNELRVQLAMNGYEAGLADFAPDTIRRSFYDHLPQLS